MGNKQWPACGRTHELFAPHWEQGRPRPWNGSVSLLEGDGGVPACLLKKCNNGGVFRRVSENPPQELQLLRRLIGDGLSPLTPRRSRERP